MGKRAADQSVPARGPETRSNATPQRPAPELSAAMVSLEIVPSSASCEDGTELLCCCCLCSPTLQNVRLRLSAREGRRNEPVTLDDVARPSLPVFLLLKRDNLAHIPYVR